MKVPIGHPGEGSAGGTGVGSGPVSRETNWIWFRPRTTPPALRLFCFPYAGGGATTYHSWQSSFPPSIEICPVQLPGRETRLQEKPYTRLRSLIPDLAAALQPYLDVPFAFFGHSMGALIGFELARYLQARNQVPRLVLVSGQRAPQLAYHGPTTYDLPEEEFVDRLRALNGTPTAVLDSPELRALLIPVLRADLGIGETYEYRDSESLHCPMTVFFGSEDGETNVAEIAQWARLTTEHCRTVVLPGDHFFIRSAHERLVRECVADLSAVIGEPR